MSVKCTNPDCPALEETGAPAEFEDGYMYCDYCGLPLPQLEASSPLSPQSEDATAVTGAIEDEPPPALQSSSTGRAKLIVTRGAQPGVEYPLNLGENQIGRWDDGVDAMPHVDLESQDVEGFVHRKHAAIRFEDGQWWLEHLPEPPSNPTRIRGRSEALEPGKPVPLKNGDEIAVGRVLLRFLVE